MPNELLYEILFMFTPWWGKTLGTLFGYLIAGPMGAVFGIIIGNIFDRGLFNYLYSPQWHHYRQASTEVKNLFTSVLFKVMGHLAKTDGRITEEDIHIARAIMKEMRLFGRDKRQAMKFYNEGKQAQFNLERNLHIVNMLCQNRPELVKLFVETLYRSTQTERVSKTKQHKLNLIFSRLGFKPMYNAGSHSSTNEHRGSYQSKDHQRYQAKYNPPVEKLNDYAVLGVPTSAKKSDIKRAYRKKMSQIHPDKLIARGASKSEVQQATIKAQQLQAAYDRIKKSRGF